MVDGMNVIGTRPDGWWRDIDGAVIRLARCLAAAPNCFSSQAASPGLTVRDNPVGNRCCRSHARRSSFLPIS